MTFQAIEVHPLTGRIGAKIKGVDLSDRLSDETIAEIRTALIQHKVIFFRGQDKLDATGQIAFARRFGSVTTAHPTVPALAEHPEVLDLDYGKTVNRANQWHTDVTFVDRPPLGSVLRALVIPPYGGDTIWANSVTAYQDLPQHLRELADSLWAVHSNDYDYAAAIDLPEDVRAHRAIFTATKYETSHPVVRVHPESSERGLFIGGFVRRLRGFSTSESQAILELLQSYVTRPENTVRWRWKVGDVAFWDNRSTQHYAVADYGNQPRRVQRVTIAGDLPIGVDGNHSEAIQGDSSTYTPPTPAKIAVAA